MIYNMLSLLCLPPSPPSPPSLLWVLPFPSPQTGIESTAPRSSTHQQNTYNQGVATLSVTGVKVQRSHSFTPDSSSSTQQKRVSPYSRLRSSLRPQSYYENDGNSAGLVIGQQPLSFTQVQNNYFVYMLCACSCVSLKFNPSSPSLSPFPPSPSLSPSSPPLSLPHFLLLTT